MVRNGPGILEPLNLESCKMEQANVRVGAAVPNDHTLTLSQVFVEKLL